MMPSHTQTLDVELWDLVVFLLVWGSLESSWSFFAITISFLLFEVEIFSE